MAHAAEPLADAPLPPSAAVFLEAVGAGARSYPLEKTRTLIGRGIEADLRVDDPSASRKHASVFFTGDEFRVRDESSLNGTLLNGSRVVEYAIRDGDELLVGDTLLRFRCQSGCRHRCARQHLPAPVEPQRT
jgi:predicted component of type VI protein secretion system